MGRGPTVDEEGSVTVGVPVSSPGSAGKALERDGFVVIERFLDPTLGAALRCEVDEALAAPPVPGASVRTIGWCRCAGTTLRSM
jgi:hypothetical protein